VIVQLAVLRVRRVAETEQVIHLELRRNIRYGCELSFLVPTETINVAHRGSCLVDGVHYDIAGHQGKP
jgi:hypothetical protein